MTTRDEHHEAVGFAGQQIENELLPLLAQAKDRAEDLIATVQNAVGGNPSSEAGQNALAFIASFPEKLEEMLGIAHAAIAELNRYGGGF